MERRQGQAQFEHQGGAAVEWEHPLPARRHDAERAEAAEAGSGAGHDEEPRRCDGGEIGWEQQRHHGTDREREGAKNRRVQPGERQQRFAHMRAQGGRGAVVPGAAVDVREDHRPDHRGQRSRQPGNRAGEGVVSEQRGAADRRDDPAVPTGERRPQQHAREDGQADLEQASERGTVPHRPPRHRSRGDDDGQCARDDQTGQRAGEPEAPCQHGREDHLERGVDHLQHGVRTEPPGSAEIDQAVGIDLVRQNRCPESAQRHRDGGIGHDEGGSEPERSQAPEYGEDVAQRAPRHPLAFEVAGGTGGSVEQLDLHPAKNSEIGIPGVPHGETEERPTAERGGTEFTGQDDSANAEQHLGRAPRHSVQRHALQQAPPTDPFGGRVRPALDCTDGGHWIARAFRRTHAHPPTRTKRTSAVSRIASVRASCFRRAASAVPMPAHRDGGSTKKLPAYAAPAGRRIGRKPRSGSIVNHIQV